MIGNRLTIRTGHEWLYVILLAFITNLFLGVAWAGDVPTTARQSATPEQRARVIEAFGQSPLHFEPNQGQAAANVKFLARVPGYQLFLTPNEAVLAAHGKDQTVSRVRMQLTGEGVNPQPVVEGVEALAARSNYYLGNDPQQWQTGVPHFAKVRYSQVYPGVDWVLYGNLRQLEYDFIVAPGTDPKVIHLRLAGADEARIADNGELVVSATGREVLHSSPTIYQMVNGERQIVEGRYVLRESVENVPVVGFEIAEYNRELPLVIDPIIYLASIVGNSDDFGWDITVDSLGSAYITGFTVSSSFSFPVPELEPLISFTPEDVINYDTTFGGGKDVFVARLNISGIVDYFTYLGGSSYDYGYGIALDNQSNFYVTGSTRSSNFPIASSIIRSQAGLVSEGDPVIITAESLLPPATPGTPYTQLFTSAGGQCAPVAPETTCTVTYTWTLDPSTSGNLPNGLTLNSNGTLSGTPTADAAGTYSFIVDVADNNAPTPAKARKSFSLVVGGVIQNKLAGTQDAFVAKFDASTGQLVYSTYLGGSKNTAGGGGVESGQAIIVDDPGNAYVVGYTNSTDFPVKGGFNSTQGGGDSPFDPTYNNLDDVFVAKLNAAGTALEYSTFLGGSGDERGFGIVLDAASNAYVVGYTDSPDFPNAGGLTSCTDRLGTHNNYEEVFVAKLNEAGNALIYSTCFGGSRYDRGQGIDIDASNNAYITGYTDSPDVGRVLEPLSVNLYSVDGRGFDLDAFVAKLDLDGKPTFFTYLGGNANDVGNDIAVDCCGSMGTYITGYTVSPDFPLLRSDDLVWEGSTEAFITRLDSNTGTLTYSSFWGGDGNEYGMGIALDAALDVYIVGYDHDAFVVKVSIPISNSFTVSVTGGGTGSGTINSSPFGISCIIPDPAASPGGLTEGDCYESYVPSTVVTLTAIPDSDPKSVFSGWSGDCTGVEPCLLTLDANKQVAATFTSLVTSTLTVAKEGTGTVTSSPEGIDCGADCSEDYQVGSLVTLTAVPAAGSIFKGWSGGCSGEATVCTLAVMSDAQTVTATFESMNALTVNRIGNGSVTSDPVGISCGTVCQKNYAIDSPVTLKAVADTGWAFAGWGGDCAQATGDCTITMNAAKNVTVIFREIGKLSLLVEIDPTSTGSGTVTSDPTGINCGNDCQESYAEGTQVTLVAQADINSFFEGWSDACSGASRCGVTINADQRVAARFISANPDLSFTSLVSPKPREGTQPVVENGQRNISFELAVKNNGRVATGAFQVKFYFSTDTIIDPDSDPSAGKECTFSTLAAGATSSCGGNIMLPLPSAQLTSGKYYLGAYANFDGKDISKATVEPFTLRQLETRLDAPGNGTVYSQPSGIACSVTTNCKLLLLTDDEVTLTQVAKTGFTFASWGEACAGLKDCVLTMSDDRNATAHYLANNAGKVALTVYKVGTGTVAANDPAAIDCGTDCWEPYTLADNKIVTLTATPTSGTTFTGWSGACTGTSTCTVTMSAFKTVTATFSDGTSGSDDPATLLITHYYTSILGREPDASGLEFWLGLIAEKQAQGEDVKPVFRDMAFFFFNSPEYLGNNTSDTQFTTDLYRTFFQREPDTAGQAFWLEQLTAGAVRNDVMAGFLYSPEFTEFMEKTLNP